MEIDKYIVQAESILLNGATFNDERKVFIRNLETCDLLAVPGSGKTTALLAKLYCIAQNIPFEDGSGILILSHTNKAIEEIEKKLKGHCPKLFEYPNFIGTVQTFVNKFLSIPFYENKNRQRITSIDDEYHNYRLDKVILKSFSANTHLKHIYRTPQIPWKYNFELSQTPNQIIDLDTGKRIVITRPRGRAKNPIDWSVTEKNNIEKNLYKIKVKLLTDGILNFNDSYFYAKIYLTKIPIIKKFLQQRFKYVFIDEMQDLEDFQIKIIDDIFFDNSSQTVIQRIGDKNQSIYNSVKENCDWKTRQEVDPENYTDLSIQNSMRLSPKIANLVDKFVLNRPTDYNVVGKFEESTLPPHLILIDHNTTGESLKTKFKEIIEEHDLHSESKNLEKGFHIVSWTTENDNENAICLKKLFPRFSKELKRKKGDFDCLKKHLFLFDREKPTLEGIRKSILNALIRILDLENIKTLENKNYTKSKLFSFIINQGEECYENFKAKLFKWCFNIITKESYNETYEEIKTFIEGENFIGLNWYNEEEYIPKRILASREFINKDFPFISEDDDETEENETDIYPINLSSVHSVKGQTHCATMYVESFYYEYETKKLQVVIPSTKKKPEEILPNPLFNQYQTYRPNKDVRAKETLKMMYVGFSRPTHLLCFAVLKENIQDHIESLKIENGGIWKIIEDLV
ncbi:UvrD-helicase domain-containing protein [Chryseobacterium sp. PS-8]|uniref:DNA 3'-5' helicase II n=1 Tax=Chryseobacterium indicum TaxID=2766954 RepID=A0ABS9C1W9_9FLAO|nr:UvrD-helicase domain-containing protein [Chryseobacterium sp. PS-8]MCF2218212.1 UvrD-helicase domain-containing protein [Chryseobacterium sp. PS-8]